MNESAIHITFKDINDSNFKSEFKNYISNEPENINNLENFTNSWSIINEVHNSNINTSNPIYFNQNISPNDLDSTSEWGLAADYLSEAGIKAKLAGADFLVIYTNTMHKVVEKIERQTGLPLLHIADATGERITKTGFTKVGLLGTAFTMEQSFYKDRLINKFNLEVLTPKRYR